MPSSFAAAANAARSKVAPDADPDFEKKPEMAPDQDPNTVSDMRRLTGAKGLSYLKERKTWETALAFVWRPENDGQDNGSAPGEAFLTRWGVIQATWDAAVDEGIVPDIALQDATKDQLASILRANYWNVCRCDSFVAAGEPGTALMLFNMGMQAGTGRAARLLQRIVGAAEDGQIGPLTVAAATHVTPAKLIPALVKADEAFFASCRQANRFLRGWDRRVTDGATLAMALQQNA